MQFAGRPVQDDVSVGRWIADAVRTDGTVGSLLPPVFEAYARVFHPAARFDGLDDLDVSWAEVAAANVTVAHPAMQWGSITGLMEYLDQGDQSPLWDMAPAQGHLPEQIAERLIEVLGGHSSTPDDCWFGVWTGWGGLAADAPALPVRGEGYWLVRGPIDLAADNFDEEPSAHSASLWWPADRAWLVATDVDLVTTYVGGSAACVAELLAHPGLEAAAVSASQRITWDADSVNPPPFDAD